MAAGNFWHYSAASGAIDLTVTLNANAQRLVSFKLQPMATADPKVPFVVDLYDGTGTTVTDGTATKIGSWSINKTATQDYIANEPAITLYMANSNVNQGSGYLVRSGSLRIDVTQGTGTNDQKFIPHLLLADAE